MDDIGIPGTVLMENAGRGMAELLRSLGIEGKVVICCGPGNNGGDGFVIARHLDIAGVRPRVLLFARPQALAGDAALNHRVLTRCGVTVEVCDPAALDEASLRSALASADWVVDALFGIGQSGPLRAPFDRIVAAINESGASILAVDLPSGLDADTGRPHGTTIRATHTATVAAPKAGFAAPESREWTGRVHVVGMGIPVR
jgi:NAD(P)H-hydrate epimerase